jgi:hypothetical protein
MTWRAGWVRRKLPSELAGRVGTAQRTPCEHAYVLKIAWQ